jgi:hypothetical protein
MIFDESSQSIETCGQKLRVSNTGLAVSEEDYQSIMTRTEWKLDNKANRFKRQTQTDEYVTESEFSFPFHFHLLPTECRELLANL